jgi:hypothetical protein
VEVVSSAKSSTCLFYLVLFLYFRLARNQDTGFSIVTFNHQNWVVSLRYFVLVGGAAVIHAIDF